MDDAPFDEAGARDMLAEPLTGILAVRAAHGPPAATPLWHAVTDEGLVWVLTPASSRKARLLAATGCATLVVHTVEPRVRYVSVDLDVVGTRPGTVDDRREIASRYLAGDALDRYLAFAADGLPDEQRVTLRPTRWRFADLTG